MLNETELKQRKQDYMSGMEWDELGKKWNVCPDGARMFVKYRKWERPGDESKEVLQEALSVLSNSIASIYGDESAGPSIKKCYIKVAKIKLGLVK